VTALGLLAILAAEFLPEWIDPVMERVFGVTLLRLAGYLFYSLFRYFRDKGEFRIRSRWMLIFAGVRNAVNWLLARFRGRKEHAHVHAVDQYGPKTAYGIGLIHGIGAETGTQVLIIATAVGAGTKFMGIAALLFFVTGLLISNTFVTIATASGFVSAQRRQLVYILAGAIAAVFSLVVGLIFLFEAGGILPDLGIYFRWIGGPDA
jgi:high-affinity nickel-transport protein